MRQQRRDLPVALSRAIAVGTVAGEADIARCPVNVALQHQLVGKLPHRPLVHSRIADVGQHRLHQPVHHLHRVALQLIFDIAVECRERIGMAAPLHMLQPLVVHPHSPLQVALTLRFQFTAQETRLMRGWQILVHQRLVVLRPVQIMLAHRGYVRIIAQFVIHIVICLVVRTHSQRVDALGAHGVEHDKCLVVHARIGTADGHERTAAHRIRLTPHLVGKRDAAVEEEDGGVADERLVELVEREVTVKLAHLGGFLLQRTPCLCYLVFVLGYIDGRLRDGIIHHGIVYLLC